MTNDAGEGEDCVGTPTDDVELRCVLAGPGAASLEPDEFMSVMALSTLTAAAEMRPTRAGVLMDSDLALLPLLFILTVCPRCIQLPFEVWATRVGNDLSHNVCELTVWYVICKQAPLCGFAADGLIIVDQNLGAEMHKALSFAS